MLFLSLLGDAVACSRAGAPIRAFRTQKALALFAFLALERRTSVRDELAHLLWSDVGLDQARHSLRQALLEIRQVIGPAHEGLLRADRWTVNINRRQLRVDVHLFQKLVRCRTARSLRHACDLYRGDVLAGLQTRERLFDEWLAAERTRLREIAIAAREDYLCILTTSGNYVEAVPVAEGLIRLEPFSDRAHRMVASTYAQAGQVHRARQHLHGYLKLLIEARRAPEEDTLEMLNQLTRRV